jgi:hypothetical protein
VADAPFPAPEDRAQATLSALGQVEYVTNLLRPGRILLVAAEEGAGKSYAISSELAIRLAVAGGAFAETWPIARLGPVLVLSEMHSDDDFHREETTLASLNLDRAALSGRYFRLGALTAAHGEPPLDVLAWRQWIVDWCRDQGIIALIFDTVTSATDIDPWGSPMHEVIRDLRLMLEEDPELAIVLVVHLRKPNGHAGQRQISDVLGEWGRWCDVVLLLERDGERTKLSTYKRVEHERRVLATREGGLLVDPMDIANGHGPKVSQAQLVAAVSASPGCTQAQLADELGVAKRTVGNYLASAEQDRLVYVIKGPNRQWFVYPGQVDPP